MHACTYAHKHSDVRTQLLPRYIIISTLYRLCAALELRRGRREERVEEGVGSMCESRTAGLHTTQCNSAVCSPRLQPQNIPGLEKYEILTMCFPVSFNMNITRISEKDPLCLVVKYLQN